jgi:hypothetical protein
VEELRVRLEADGLEEIDQHVPPTRDMKRARDWAGEHRERPEDRDERYKLELQAELRALRASYEEMAP